MISRNNALSVELLMSPWPMMNLRRTSKITKSAFHGMEIQEVKSGSDTSFRALAGHLAEGKTLSVPQRRALSRVLGVPVDRLTAPEFGQALQQSFALERAQQRPQPRPSPPRGGRGARQPITLQTPVQRIENR